MSPGDDEQRAVVVVASTARWRGEKKEVVIRDDRELEGQPRVSEKRS